MKTVYVTIGNSDNKLTQSEWRSYTDDLTKCIRLYYSVIFGEFYSLPNSFVQNACYSGQIRQMNIPEFKQELKKLAKKYNQDSIAIVFGESELLEPN